MQWRTILSDGTRTLVDGYSYTDGLNVAQKLDPRVDDVDDADSCQGKCYCNDDQGAGYTYSDEYGDCQHCEGDCDCVWLGAN